MNFKYKDLAKKLTQEAISKFFIVDKNIFQKNPKDNDDVFFRPIDIGAKVRLEEIEAMAFVKFNLLADALSTRSEPYLS